MKKIFAVLMALTLCTAMVAAQDPQPTQTQTEVGQPTDTNEPVFKGCLSGTKDNYVLTTSDGKSYRLHSDKDINEHVGKMVEIRGTEKKEGADRPGDNDAQPRMSELDVADVKSVEGGNCPAASDSSAAASTSEPVKSDATDQASASTASEPSAASQATVTEQPANQPAATETTSQPEASASASATSEPSASAAVSTENQTASVSADPQTGVNADVDANKATDTEVASTDASQNAQADAAQLPETASALPLLGLIGFAATGLGLLMRRK